MLKLNLKKYKNIKEAKMFVEHKSAQLESEQVSNKAENNSVLVNKIDEKLKLMNEICSNVEILVDYKNTNTKLSDKTEIASGIVDKRINISKLNWKISDHKKLTASIIYSNNQVTLSIQNLFYIYFDLNSLDNNTKDMFNDHLFCEMLDKELDSIKYGTEYNVFMFSVNQLDLIFPTRYFNVDLSNIKKLEDIDRINNAFKELTADVRKAITNTADKFMENSFTVDDFDEEEEE